jgi:hypothetical protein
VLDRLAREIQVREDRIAVLEGREPESAEPARDEEYDLDADPDTAASGSERASESAVVSESETVSQSDAVSESKTRSDDDATAPVQPSRENEQASE